MLSHRPDSKRAITWRGDLLRTKLFESAYSAARNDVLPLIARLGFTAELPIDVPDDLTLPAGLKPNLRGAVGAGLSGPSYEDPGNPGDLRNEGAIWVPTEYRSCWSPQEQPADESQYGSNELEELHAEERDGEPRKETYRERVQAVPYRPMATWPQLRTRLQPLLQGSVQTRTIDEKALIQKLCRCESLTTLPRRRCKRGPQRLLVMEDRSERCIPFLADERFVKERLQWELAVGQSRFVSGDSRDLLVGRYVSRRVMQDAPSLNQSQMQYDTDPPATVLILGDLGVLERDDRELVELWVQCCERWRQRGIAVFALVPFALERMPRAFRGLVTPIAWQGNEPTGYDDLMRQEILHQIFVRTYPAMRLEPALLRELRVMVPGATDASLESEVWQHEWLASNHIAAARHDRREVKDRLREAFEQLSDEIKRRILSIQRRFRLTTGYRETWLAELVNLSPETRKLIEDFPEDEVAMQQIILKYASFVKRRCVPAEERDRMGWFARSVSDGALEDPVVGESVRLLQRTFCREEAWHQATRLKEVASDGVTRTVTLAGLPDGITAAREPEELSNTGGSGLRVTLPSTSRGIEIQVPATDIVHTREKAFWKSGTKPQWVSDYGTDRYGAWCEFQVPRHEGEGMVTQRLRWIPPGKFMMGSQKSHLVRITQGYWLADSSVTQELWMAIDRKKNPSHFEGPTLPVESVSWNDCQGWLRKLNEACASLSARFPTEAEWEYGCRAGSTTAYCFGDDEQELPKYAWFDKNSKGKTHAVKQLLPNGLGLYDMHGNVWEWCNDWWGDYSSKKAIDPTGPETGLRRVVRGGSWFNGASLVRSASRYAGDPGARRGYLGFRLLSSADGAEPSEGASTPAAEPGVERGREGSAQREYVFVRSLDLDDRSPRALDVGFAELDFESLDSVRVISDTDGYQFDRLSRPAWAVDFGCDAYGLYATFEVQPISPPSSKKSRSRKRSKQPADPPTAVRQRLRWIPPGRFLMGSPENEVGRAENETQHWVNLTHGYWMFDTPCTQALWECVMGSNPSYFVDPERPVEQVSWEDVSEFVTRLAERLPKSLRFRLPTEAEWEYACRAGTTKATYAGDLEIWGDANAPGLDRIAWYGGNSGHEYDLPTTKSLQVDWLTTRQYPENAGGARKVAKKAPNGWGLYDMLGNVLEWCRDWYESYSRLEKTDPVGPRKGRVLRGGGWIAPARSNRSACRGSYDPEHRGAYVGFRLVSCVFDPSEVIPDERNPFGISNTAGWTEEQISARLLEVKTVLDWDNTTGSARKWWQAFEDENPTRTALVLRLAEELAVRGATITQFFLAYVFSLVDNIQANLDYLDHTRLKKLPKDDHWAGWAPKLSASGFTNTDGWSEDQIRSKLEEVKVGLDWANATGSARKWWDVLENQNKVKLDLILRLAEELAVRKATITEFFLAHAYSNTDNIQAILHYLDYSRLKKEEEKKKKAAVSASQTPSVPTEPELPDRPASTDESTE